MPPRKPRPTTKSGKPRARKGVKIKPTELGAQSLRAGLDDPSVAELVKAVASDGGEVLAAYKEPLGGHHILFAALPLDKVEPTPYQRDVSDGHVRKLTVAMDKTRRYLDPIIAVRVDKGYQTPNGNHRLTVMRELGAKSILALLVPEREVAFQILALNIEKAHNLRERSLEVQRMYEALVKETPTRPEADCVLEFEDASLATLGFCYAERPRISGGAYQSVLKKIDALQSSPLSKAVDERRRRAKVLLELDDAVQGAVDRLKAAGLTSPYLKAFVVGRINPLRFMKGSVPPFDELLTTMKKRAAGLDAGKIKPSDISASGGAPDEE
jgi:ParB family chromosome partitioning protein